MTKQKEEQADLEVQAGKYPRELEADLKMNGGFKMNTKVRNNIGTANYR